jgi:magnesium-transporting ATPase (P-type)
LPVRRNFSEGGKSSPRCARRKLPKNRGNIGSNYINMSAIKEFLKSDMWKMGIRILHIGIVGIVILIIGLVLFFATKEAYPEEDIVALLVATIFYGLVILLFFLILRRKAREERKPLEKRAWETTYQITPRLYFLYLFLGLVLLVGVVATIGAFGFQEFLATWPLWMLILLFFLSGITTIIIANWIYRDARRRNMSASRWAFAAIYLPVVSWIWYFFKRKEHSIVNPPEEKTLRPTFKGFFSAAWFVAKIILILIGIMVLIFILEHFLSYKY